MPTNAVRALQPASFGQLRLERCTSSKPCHGGPTPLRGASRLLLALLVCFTLPGLGQNSVSLVGAGSTVPLPLYRKWSAEFNKINHAVQMQYQALGANEGVTLVSGDSEELGKADFGAGEVALSDKAREEGHLIELPVVIIGIVPVYNLPGNPGLKFSGELLAQILLGRIKRWNDPGIAQLNPGVALPAVPIKVIYRPGGKGTNFVLTDFLSKTSPEFRQQIGRTSSPKWPVGEPAERSSDMVDKVSATVGAIGYVELQYALKAYLPFGLVRNSAGKFIKASEESILAACRGAEVPEWNKFSASMTNTPGADSFPIASFSWLYLRTVSTDARRRGALLNLLNWIYSSGQQLAAEQGYTQLPAPLLEKIKARIEALN
jgi:phosphate transport system substrate-binding protein